MPNEKWVDTPWLCIYFMQKDTKLSKREKIKICSGQIFIDLQIFYLLFNF
jgi:hypothetical protein